jgi:hypothetical protein
VVCTPLQEKIFVTDTTREQNLFPEARTEPAGVPTPGFILRALERRAERAAALGLVAKWSREFGFISIHDPTTGEWHDVTTKDAPSWARWEAGTRKRIYRAGRWDAFELNARQMAEIWEAEHPPEEVEPEEGEEQAE